MAKIKWFAAFGILVLFCCCDEAAAGYKSKMKKVTSFLSPSEAVSDTSIVDQHDEGMPPGGDLTIEPPPSPECWKSAIAVFQKVQQTHFADDATRLCQVLPEQQQKLLALEIAKCHLQDLGKPLIQDRNILSECTVHATRDKEVIESKEEGEGDNKNKNKLQNCLKHLTDAGVNAYTHYVSYIQILCTRLTQELIASHQQETHKEMALRYADISTHSIEQMESIREIAHKHAEHMEALTHVPEQVKEELQSTLEETLSQSLHEHLKEQLQVQLKEQLEGRLSDLLQRQATEQAFILETILDQVQARDDEQKERYESWTLDQTTLLQNQVQALEEQRQKMDEQREKMNVLSETVSKTTQTMQPLLGLQSMVTAATKGYTWITFLLHFLGTFNVIWLMTRPQRCQRFRYQLFAVVMTEAVLEIALTGLVQYKVILESERVQAIAELRRWAVFLECFLYVIGMIVSSLVSDKEDDDSLDDEKNASSLTVKSPTDVAVVEEIQRRQEELVHKLEAAMDRAGRESDIFYPHSRAAANVSANSRTTHHHHPTAGFSAAAPASSLLGSSARMSDSAASNNHCVYSGAVVTPPNASEPAPYYTHASSAGYNHDPSTNRHWNTHTDIPQRRYRQPTPYSAPGGWNEMEQQQHRQPVYSSSPNNNHNNRYIVVDDYPSAIRQAATVAAPAAAASRGTTAMQPSSAASTEDYYDALSDPRDGNMILSNPLPQPDTRTAAVETIDRMPTTESQEHASLSGRRRSNNKRPADEASYLSPLEGREGDDEPPTKKSRSEED